MVNICTAMYMQACLLREASVKDVHPDRQLTRSLMWQPSGDTFIASLHHDAADGTVRKRPGRWAVLQQSCMVCSSIQGSSGFGRLSRNASLHAALSRCPLADEYLAETHCS